MINLISSIQGPYLQPIYVGQDIGMSESFCAFESRFGKLCLLLRSLWNLIHKDWHQLTSGLE